MDKIKKNYAIKIITKILRKIKHVFSIRYK